MSRSGLETLGAEGGGGFLEAGDWQATLGYRHMYSHIHFTGRTENVYRQEPGINNPIMQKTNMEDLMVTYQATDRVSLQLTLPFLSASRRSNTGIGTLHTSGIGDVSVLAQCWVWNPKQVKVRKRGARPWPAHADGQRQLRK